MHVMKVHFCVVFTLLVVASCCCSIGVARKGERLEIVYREAREYRLDGEKYLFFGDLSDGLLSIIRALKYDNYKLSKINFSDGDVVLDIGGNVGAFSIPLARKYPFLKIHAFEPVKQSFDNFQKNIQVNGIAGGVITVHKKAITKNGRNVTMFLAQNSAWNAMSEMVSKDTFVENFFPETQENVESMTLAQVFEAYQIKQCKLLKMDCEGCEYEVLYNAEDDVLKKVEVFRGEFHAFPSLFKKNLTPKKLFDDIQNKFADVDVELQTLEDNFRNAEWDMKRTAENIIKFNKRKKNEKKKRKKRKE